MRRRFLAVFVALALVAGLACGSDSKEESSSQAASGTQAAGAATAAVQSAPAPLNDIAVGVPADTANVQGDKATLGIYAPNANIYEALLRMDGSYQVQPWLADRYEFVEPNTWRFYLRRDVKFHDGTPMTAKDVVYTFDRRSRGGGNTINAAEGGTKAIDDYTVEFTPSRPNRKVPLQVVHPGYGILKAGSDPVAAPVGTGPFKFVEYRPKESYKVERWAEYWNPAAAAKVKSITFKFIPDNNARVLALKAGDVDIITQVPRESVAEIKNDSKLKVALSPVGAYEAIQVTVNGEGEFALTGDRRIREAIAKGIDRETIVKQVWEGNAEIGKTIVPPSILGPAKDKVAGGAKYDPEGAKKILDDAGWRAGGDGVRVKDGRRLEIVLVNGFPEPETHRPIPEVVQSQLRKIGIDLKIVETGTAYEDMLKTGKGHMWMERGNQNDANPAFLPNLLYRSVPGGNAGSDYGMWFGIGAKVDEPMNQAQATADIAKTQDSTAQAMRALIDEEFVLIPIAGLYNITAHSNRIEGFAPHAALIHTDLRGVIKR